MEIKKKVIYVEIDTPIGPLTVASTSKGVCWLDFGNGAKALNNLKRWTMKWFNTELIECRPGDCTEIIHQIEQYFNGQLSEFKLPIDLYGTPFQKMVWHSLLEIPYGETRSYKDIALQIGAPKAVRAIGGANNRNPIPIIIPCHRVIGSNGALVGYGGGLEIKEHLLGMEGGRWFYLTVKNTVSDE